MNSRKERLNNINNKLMGMSQKILALYNVQAAMRIQSPAVYPNLETMTSA